MTQELFIGLMSGTSMDGIDGVLIDLAPAADFNVLQHCHQPFNAALRETLFALNQPGDNELHRAALAANALALAYADVVSALLGQSGRNSTDVRAIGAHGQTVRHRPGAFDGLGYTCQLLSGAVLAETTGIDVVCDFRSRDVSAGGQGAPLVPAFHQAAFSSRDTDTAVLNIGGIANITFLPATGPVGGMDCGPGNVLIDAWCLQHTGQRFDHDGAWARSGRLHTGLLARFLQDSFIQQNPPKSTGRDHYNDDWLANQVHGLNHHHLKIAPPDVQNTLVHFTVQAAVREVQRSLPSTKRLLVCGGGALNRYMMDCMREALPGVSVAPVNETCRLEPMHVEAAAFAWMAKAHLDRHPANCPTVTGANGPRILGACYPA
jgi:anhydro-N-acetylmuramic acid kinase